MLVALPLELEMLPPDQHPIMFLPMGFFIGCEV